MPPFRRASAFLCYIWKKNNPLFLEGRNSDCLVLPPAMHPELSKFRISEKKVENIFSRALLSVGIRSLLSAMYWKSSKVRIFWISLQIYLRELLPSNSYVLEMEETDIFRCFQRNFFLRLIATGEAGILLSSYLLWTTATQNHGRICKFVPLLTAMYLKEEKIPISSCFSEKIFKIFRSTLQLKESISFCQLCSQKR